MRSKAKRQRREKPIENNDVAGKSKVQLCLITKTGTSETTSAERVKYVSLFWLCFAIRGTKCPRKAHLNIDEKSSEM